MAPVGGTTGAAPGPLACGLGGLCPRCGARTLFAGPLRFAERCAACGLDLAGFNVGDGPAAFLTMGIGTLVCVAAVAVALAFDPPWWVHVLLWVPLTFAAVVAALRVAKGVLLAMEYRTAAREGRLKDVPGDRPGRTEGKG